MIQLAICNILFILSSAFLHLHVISELPCAYRRAEGRFADARRLAGLAIGRASQNADAIESSISD